MTPSETPPLPVTPGREGRPEWRPVPGWPYEASARGWGRVRSLARGVPLKRSLDPDGYPYVELSDGRRRQRIHLARVMLLAFRGEPPTPEHEALHGNGRRWDCRPANLRWGTKPENRQDRERHRRERESRDAGRRNGTTVETDGKDEKQDEMEETACCLLESESGVSPC